MDLASADDLKQHARADKLLLLIVTMETSSETTNMPENAAAFYVFHGD